MDTVPAPANSVGELSPEGEAERRDRMAWEAKGIAEADDELEVVLYVSAEDMRMWILSIGTDHELPPPPTRHR